MYMHVWEGSGARTDLSPARPPGHSHPPPPPPTPRTSAGAGPRRRGACPGGRGRARGRSCPGRLRGVCGWVGERGWEAGVCVRVRGWTCRGGLRARPPNPPPPRLSCLLARAPELINWASPLKSSFLNWKTGRCWRMWCLTGGGESKGWERHVEGGHSQGCVQGGGGAAVGRAPCSSLPRARCASPPPPTPTPAPLTRRHVHHAHPVLGGGAHKALGGLVGGGRRLLVPAQIRVHLGQHHEQVRVVALVCVWGGGGGGG